MFDDNRILECPVCHKRLVKVELKSVGIIVDICLDGCGGIYFGNNEMQKIIASPEATTEIKQLCEGKEFKKVDENENRVCPFCLSNMVKNYTSYSKEIQIDECYRCGSKFLDSGELEKIQAQNPDEDKEAIMKEVRAMLGQDFAVIKAENHYRNKRRSFFTKIVEKFLKK